MEKKTTLEQVEKQERYVDSQNGSTEGSVISGPPPPSLDVIQCHLKRGRCQIHNHQARKIVTNKKKMGVN